MLWECILHRSVCGPVIFSRHRQALRERGRDAEVKEGRLREGTQDANEVNKIGHSLSPPLFNSLPLMQTTLGGLLEHVTSDRRQKHEIHVRTNESIEPLVRPGCFLAPMFFWVAVLASRRLVEHHVEYKFHVEYKLHVEKLDADAASPLDGSFDAVSKTRGNFNKTGFLKSQRAKVERRLLL